MDTMGDADELGHDDLGTGGRAELLTSETSAITGAGLVLFSIISGVPLQLLQFGAFNATVDASDPAFLWFLAPAALLALGGVVFAARARRSPLTPALFGLSGAASIIGGVLLALYALAYVRLLTS
ncbi:MAG: hypothetical protein ABI807_09700 [Sporichthyaceae bacterium]